MWDCSILDGGRSVATQRKNVAKKVSKTMFSKHLTVPSIAVDVAPWPLHWPQSPGIITRLFIKAARKLMKQWATFYDFAGYVLGTAHQMGLDLRHGGDWDMDRDIHDQDFDDIVHLELIGQQYEPLLEEMRKRVNRDL